MPEAQSETWQFATSGLAILWCFTPVKRHLTPGALNSVQLTELYNMSQNIVTTARICHFDDLPHSAYFVTTYLSLAINMLHLKISKYNPLFIILHPVMCSAEAVGIFIIIPWLHFFLKETFENFEIFAAFHCYANVITRSRMRGKVFS